VAAPQSLAVPGRHVALTDLDAAASGRALALVKVAADTRTSTVRGR
jgi:hypothetical protein